MFMLQAAGISGKPGIVMISPEYAMINPEPELILTSLILRLLSELVGLFPWKDYSATSFSINFYS